MAPPTAVAVGDSDRGALPRWVRPHGARDRQHRRHDEEPDGPAGRRARAEEETPVRADTRSGVDVVHFEYVCTFFTLYRSVHPSPPRTSCVRADSSS